MLFSIGSIYVVKARDNDSYDWMGRERPKLRDMPAALAAGPIQGGALSISARATAGTLER